MARYTKTNACCFDLCIVVVDCSKSLLAAGKYLCEWDHWFVAIVVAAFRRAVESAAFDPAFGAFF